jgi:transcription elongation factor Elf1
MTFKVCDVCGKTYENTLPNSLNHVSVFSSMRKMLNFDLCSKCVAKVYKLLLSLQKENFNG